MIMEKEALMVLFLALASVKEAPARETYGDLRAVEYVRNYDGDTVTFDIRSVHPIIGDEISVRVYGIDTPEMRGKCARERVMASKAKMVVQNELRNAHRIYLKDISRGKYFRIVAEIETENGSIAQKLLDKGLAVEYYGGTKVKDWCDAQ